MATCTDSTWATEPDRRSVGAQALQILGATVHAGCRKQSFYATSSTEAEFDARYHGVKRAKVVRNPMQSAGISNGFRNIIGSKIDSKPATAYTVAEHSPSGAKHLGLKYLQMC